MNINLLLFGVLPLIAFVVIDSFLGLKAGLISAIILAMAETIYSLYEFGSLDYISLISFLMVGIFAFFSFKSNNAIYMKLQPVFLGLGLGAFFIIMQLLGKPLLIVLFEKYDALIPRELQNNIKNPAAMALFSRLSLIVGFGFLAHASCVAYAAFRMSTWWWLFIRGIGLYLMLFFCALAVKFT